MKWNPYHAKDNRIVDSSSIIDIKNYINLQARSGVYIFMSRDHHIKYVGKAGPRRMKHEVYNAIQVRNKDKGATRVKALYTNSEENALQLERKLIDYYNPSNNFN